MKCAAFLRAVNVGGRVVKMDVLRGLFEQMQFTDVRTFIASGNVVFESASGSPAKVEQRIEQTLERALGYRVTTFVRTLAELVALVEHPAFSDAARDDGATMYVVFLRQKPSAAVTRALMAKANAVDSFRVHERHVFWFVRGSFSDSKLAGPKLENVLGMPGTVRNATTVRKMAAKFG
jgi:uncharacterized protein (DUF1697 family)